MNDALTKEPFVNLFLFVSLSLSISIVCVFCPVCYSPSCPFPFVQQACFISPWWNAACMQSPPSPLPISYRMIQWMGFISNENTQRMGGVRRNLHTPAVPWYQSQLHTLSPWDVSSVGKLVYVSLLIWVENTVLIQHSTTVLHAFCLCGLHILWSLDEPVFVNCWAALRRM